MSKSIYTQEQFDKILEERNELANENYKLKQQLAEKEKELEEVKKSKTYIMNFGDKVKEVQVVDDNQDKISFALDQLEKVKGFVKENESWEIEGSDYSIVYADDVLDEIDNQIEELKKEIVNDKEKS